MLLLFWVAEGAASFVGLWWWVVRAEGALQLVEAHADEGDLRRLLQVEEALLAQGRRRLPGRRRARGGLLEVGDAAARRRPAAVVVVGSESNKSGWGWERRGAGRREGRGGGGLVELGRRRHAFACWGS